MKILIELEGVSELLKFIQYFSDPDLPADLGYLDNHLKQVSEELLLSIIANKPINKYTVTESVETDVKRFLEMDEVRDIINDQISHYLSRLIIREKLKRVSVKDSLGTLLLHLDKGCLK